MPTSEEFAADVRRHDEQIAALGLNIWVGSEPTFTDRAEQSPEWLNQALGGDKERRAQALLAGLCRRFPGALVVRSIGRQYPDEDLPRWNLGLYRRRDGQPIWQGPPDPLLAMPSAADHTVCELATWAAALAPALAQRGLRVDRLRPETAQCSPALEQRLLICADPALPTLDPADPRLARPSIHAGATPAGGLRDELAEAGAYLLILSRQDGGQARIELPLFSTVALCLAVLDSIAQASLTVRLPALILAGYPPPVDASLAWTTVTPDPAVIEINTAPSVDAADFLARSRAIYAAAAEQRLAPYRLYFNGAVADSGGAGQITLGGPSPQASPFLQEPRLLPRLVRFLNRHPSLSYFYAHDFVGSSGQSVRADERGCDAFDELGLTLALLEREKDLSPELLWHSLTPFLCDVSGNSHRAEVNIEKLWNPFLAARGKQGLVEFRALRMQHTPERATALACLLRAMTAMLARESASLPLIDWGRELHERFALPFYLERDLEAVLQALAAAGLELGEAIRSVLLHDEFRLCGQLALPGCTLEVRRALEFWPLLGDSASPEQGGGSRLVDASSARIELRLRPAAGEESSGLQVCVAGVALPMRRERDQHGALEVFGLRYRSFVPGWGLHPALAAQVPVRLLLRRAGEAVDHLVTLHEWRPAGGGYPGLPENLEEASRRRAERLTVETVARACDEPVLASPVPGLGPYCLDLRCLAC